METKTKPATNREISNLNFGLLRPITTLPQREIKIFKIFFTGLSPNAMTEMSSYASGRNFLEVKVERRGQPIKKEHCEMGVGKQHTLLRNVTLLRAAVKDCRLVPPGTGKCHREGFRLSRTSQYCSTVHSRKQGRTVTTFSFFHFKNIYPGIQFS